MNPDEKLEQWIGESGMEARPEWLRQTKTDTLNAFEQALDSKASAGKIWRTIMRNRMTQIAAVLAIAAGLISLTMLKGPVQEAYAIDQTIAAMDTIRTVYFKAEFFKQGNVECWMQFDRPGEKPSHVCLFMSGVPYRKIDSPQGSFGYNTATGRYRRNTRDERRMNWYPDFANFFKQSLEAAKRSGNVEISRRTDPAAGKERIVVCVDEKNRKVEYRIDPETKLPMEFSTREVSDFMYFFRQTIAVRNMSEIIYNQEPPAGIFDVPADAEEVTHEHDVYVRPDIGMPVGDLTPQQACEKIVRDTTAAMNARDWKTVAKLMFPFGPPPKEMEARIPADLSQPLVEILELGKPYEKDGYWYIPSKSREYGGRIKEEQVPVKFYEFDGRRYGMIMWPD